MSAKLQHLQLRILSLSGLAALTSLATLAATAVSQPTGNYAGNRPQLVEDHGKIPFKLQGQPGKRTKACAFSHPVQVTRCSSRTLQQY